MNDNDIIKALECCTSNDTCVEDKCPIFGTEYCINPIEFYGIILDLINRQKEEIDDLKRDAVPKLQWSLNRANKYGKATDEENQQLKAEIERLQGKVNRLKQYDAERDIRLHARLTATARTEAIEEFAEEYKDQIKDYTGMFKDDGFYISLQAALNAVDFIKEKMTEEKK